MNDRNAAASDAFTIEDVTPDRRRLVQWHFVSVPAMAPTARLIAYESRNRPSTRHQFLDIHGWYHPEYALRHWRGELVARPDLPEAIMNRVRETWRGYLAFE